MHTIDTASARAPHASGPSLSGPPGAHDVSGAPGQAGAPGRGSVDALASRSTPLGSLAQARTTSERLAGAPTTGERLAASATTGDRLGDLNPAGSTGAAIEAYARAAPTAPVLGLTPGQLVRAAPGTAPATAGTMVDAVKVAYGIPERGLRSVPGDVFADSRVRIDSYMSRVAGIPDAHRVSDPGRIGDPAAWRDAARGASDARNTYLQDTRSRLSESGLKVSQDMKAAPPSLEQLLDKASRKVAPTLEPGASRAARDIAAAAEVIESAGRGNAAVNAMVTHLDAAGTVVKGLAASHVLVAAGAVVDGIGLAGEARISGRTGDWSNTERAGAKVAGGWVGAALGGAAVGAAAGTIVPLVGNVGGLVIGAAVGAIGYVAGSWLGGRAFDAAVGV